MVNWAACCISIQLYRYSPRGPTDGKSSLYQPIPACTQYLIEYSICTQYLIYHISADLGSRGVARPDSTYADLCSTEDFGLGTGPSKLIQDRTKQLYLFRNFYASTAAVAISLTTFFSQCMICTAVPALIHYRTILALRTRLENSPRQN